MPPRAPLPARDHPPSASPGGPGHPPPARRAGRRGDAAGARAADGRGGRDSPGGIAARGAGSLAPLDRPPRPGGGTAGGARRGGAGPATEGQPLAGAPPPGGGRSAILERLVIRLHQASFSYRDAEPVLSGVDLTISPGLTLLLGPNGCGKSTLLKLAAGIERPDSGRIEIDGHDLWVDEVAARRGLAYLPEQPDLTPYATVREILDLVCRLRGEPRERGREALERVGLGQLAHRSVRELSMGHGPRAVLAA